MKKKTFKLLSLIAISVLSTEVDAQWNTSSTAPDAEISTGFTNILFTPQNNFNSITGNSNNSGLLINGNTGVADGAAIQITGNNSNPLLTGVPAGIIRLVSGGSLSSTESAFEVLQFNGGNYNPHFSILKNGKVGIGLGNVADFIDKLTIDGNISFKGTTNPTFRSISGQASDAGLLFYANSNANNGASIQMTSDFSSSTVSGLPAGVIRFISGGSSSTDEAFSFLQYDGGSYSPSLSIQKDGKVSIGTAWTNMPNNYKLYVSDGILTEKLKVAVLNTTHWSDYVFADNYELASLNEVEKFISKNKHLPGIPSAEEVVKEGIDVATMDAKLLQKIEELTLYVIQQQKEIEQLKKGLKK